MNIPLDATVDQRADYLREIGIWAVLPEPALRAVAAAMQPAAHSSGELIIHHGEPGRHLHVLTRGEAVVRVHAANGKVITVATMAEGACFGEMSLLSGDVTSADVAALTDCETLTLDRPMFEALVAGRPQLLRDFVRMVSQRLRASNEAMGAAREKEKDLTRFLQETRVGPDSDLVGTLPGTRALQREIDAQARLDGPVLIQGERGTGKELAAGLIHFRGVRRDGPLLCTDCGQIAETPWGDKLFGGCRRGPDEQGAAPSVSYLDLARGGTIVLKNIDALPRAIQERLAEFIAGDGPAARTAQGTVRIIATCRTDFRDLAAAQKVSPALARTLEAHVLAVPPLRDRKRDIPALADHFVRRHAQRLGRPAPALDDQSLGRLITYDYRHANVSELEDAIRRAVVLTDGERIDSEAVFLGQPPPASRWAFNLLAPGRPIVRRMLRPALRGARVLVAALFALVLWACLLAPAGAAGNLAAAAVWSVGWPLLIVSFVFAGRTCCAICPMSAAGDAAQRALSLKWRTPAWLKRHDGTILMAGFFAIIWAEEVTRMRDSPRATGVLLLTIAAGAVVTAILLPRRVWCRHLCPMGAFAGVGAMAGLIELRPTSDICAAKCKDHSCFKGDGRVEGCPLFNHVMFVDSNQHCVLCLNCVETCQHDSPQLNLRPPARDVLTASDRSRAGRWTVFLAGLLVALALLQQWEHQADGVLAHALREWRFPMVTGLLALGASLPLAGLWWLNRRLGPSPEPGIEAGFWRRITAWIAVVVAGFVCYQLAFVPGFDAVRVTLAARPPDTSAAREVSVALMSVVQGGVLLAGLAVTLGVLWNLREPAASGERRPWWRGSGTSLGIGAVYWTLLLVLILR